MTTSYSISVDGSAAARVKALRADPQNTGFSDGAMLRITVTSGGCSGFQYVLEPSTALADDDVVFGDAVVIDEASLAIINGSVVRFKNDLTGAQFVVENPNAKTGCGCGASFSV